MKTLYIKLTFIALLFVGNSFAQVGCPQCGCWPDAAMIAYANIVIQNSAPNIDGAHCVLDISGTDALSSNCYTIVDHENDTIVCEGNCQWKFKAVWKCTIDDSEPPIVFRETTYGTFTRPCTNYTSAFKKEAENVISIADIDKFINNISLFPNPIRNGEDLSVVLQSASINSRMVKIKIYTIEGKIVSDTSVPTAGSFLKIKLPYLNEGNYVINIEDPQNNTIIRKNIGVVH